MAYPNPKIYHRAKSIREDGAVSALCFKQERPINLRIASWTNRDEAVTCPKCRALMDIKPSTLAREAPTF
jgi:hypothetical protein